MFDDDEKSEVFAGIKYYVCINIEVKKKKKNFSINKTIFFLLFHFLSLSCTFSPNKY